MAARAARADGKGGEGGPPAAASRPLSGTPGGDVPAQTLVVDANAVIRGLQLQRLGGSAVTVPTMLAELRDAATRGRLAHQVATSLLDGGGIRTESPTDEQMAAVVRFARQTGDAHVLSRTDAELIALTRQLHVAMYGEASLRTRPSPTSTAKSNTAAHSSAGAARKPYSMPGWDYLPDAAGWEELDAINAAEEAIAAANSVGPGTATGPEVPRVLQDDSAHVKSGTQEAVPLSDEGSSPQANQQGDEENLGGGGWEKAVSRSTRVRKAKRAQRRAELEAGAEHLVQGVAAVDLGEDGTTAATAPEGQKEEEIEVDGVLVEEVGGADDDSEKSHTQVALVTSDFAMQNVALQMGLQLLTPDGMRIVEMRRWVLRCHACGQVSRDMGRHFCPSCGNAAMQRVQFTVGTDGTEAVGVRKRHYLRGTRYSLPKPRGGRNAQNPVLREDQLSARQRRPRPKTSAATDQDAAFLPEYGHGQHGAFGVAGALTAHHLVAPDLVGTGPNPNQRRLSARSNRRR